MLLRPAGRLGDLVPEGGGGKDLSEQGIGIQCDALHELIELLRGDGCRGRCLVGRHGGLLRVLGGGLRVLSLLGVLPLLRVLLLRRILGRALGYCPCWGY